MSQSSLVNVKMLTSHYGYPDGAKGRGGAKIDKIFVHHMAGILTAEQCGNVFKSRQASAHYGIDGKGRVGQYVLEENTAWHCANKAYNQRSIGIELANDKGASGNWHVSDKTIAKCIDLIVDICQRNDIKKINYTGDLKGNLCMHCWTASTACPGGYLKTKFKYIAEQVNKKLNGKTPVKETVYRVRKTWADAKSQVGAYMVLANAKKVADEKGLNVYDEKGNAVYKSKKKDELYRVRKTWADANSQVGAYKSLASAKKVADEHGLNVFDGNGKLVYKGNATIADNMNNWAVKIANSGAYKYKTWTNDVVTHQCPICYNLTGKYKGWNCIGFSWAVWHHGGGLKSKCSCGVINNATAEKIMKAKTDAEALKIVQEKVGLKDVKVIRNNQNRIPTDQLKKGDVCLCFSGSTYIHTIYYMGDGKIADCTSSRTPNIKANVPITSYQNNMPIKVAIRYTGK